MAISKKKNLINNFFFPTHDATARYVAETQDILVNEITIHYPEKILQRACSLTV